MERMKVVAGEMARPTHTISLHTIEEMDYALLADWFKHPSVAPHLASVPQDVTDVAQYYQDESLRARIARNEKGEIVGVFGFRKPDQNAEDKYVTLERFVVDPYRHSNGIGSAMLHEALAYAFNDLDSEGVRLRVGMGVENDEGTVKFYEKTGFITEAVLLGEKKLGVFDTIGEAMQAASLSRRRVVVSRGNGWEVEANKTQMILPRAVWQQRSIA